MKLKTGTLLIIFFWSWFMGVTAISIGFGALFPSMNRIAKPFVCPSGVMDLDKQVYNPYPGNTITTITWYCAPSAPDARTRSVKVDQLPDPLPAGPAIHPACSDPGFREFDSWITAGGAVLAACRKICARESASSKEKNSEQRTLPACDIEESRKTHLVASIPPLQSQRTHARSPVSFVNRGESANLEDKQ